MPRVRLSLITQPRLPFRIDIRQISTGLDGEGPAFRPPVASAHWGCRHRAGQRQLRPSQRSPPIIITIITFVASRAPRNLVRHPMTLLPRFDCRSSSPSAQPRRRSHVGGGHHLIAGMVTTARSRRYPAAQQPRGCAFAMRRPTRSFLLDGGSRRAAGAAPAVRREGETLEQLSAKVVGHPEAEGHPEATTTPVSVRGPIPIVLPWSRQEGRLRT